MMGDGVDCKDGKMVVCGLVAHSCKNSKSFPKQEDSQKVICLSVHTWSTISNWREENDLAGSGENKDRRETDA
jgi:hypothetical protein